MEAIRILIVDDHAILRDGIRSLLDRQKDMLVVGEAGNGLEGLRLSQEVRPDIVLMDIAMPVMNGLEATRRIKESCPAARVVILTQHDNREYIAPLLEAGASGYVLKRSGGREVANAIRQVFEYGTFLEPGLVQHALEERRQAGDTAEEAILTARERQILGLVVAGKSNKEIARGLEISPKTVSVHRTNIMSKLGVQNSAELVRYAIQHKLVKVDPGVTNA